MGSKLPLDDSGFLTRRDPKDMLGLTAGLPGQFRKGIELSESFTSQGLTQPRGIILAGVGGSASGGDLVKALIDEEGRIPFVVSRDYALPNWVEAQDLVVAASYSGNTEETLSTYEDARRRGCQIVAITSGGSLAEWAKRDHLPLIQIPAGQPPRTALGFMFAPMLRVATSLHALPIQDIEGAIRALEDTVGAFGPHVPTAENLAKQIATGLAGKFGLVYGLGGWQTAVAYRWRCQINENGKNLAISHGLPELNHNEILGWVEAAGQNPNGYACVILQGGLPTAQMKTRLRVTEHLVGSRAQFFHAKALGETRLAEMLSLCLMGDLVSIYLAALNGVDPENIDWINVLKGELSRLD